MTSPIDRSVFSSPVPVESSHLFVPLSSSSVRRTASCPDCQQPLDSRVASATKGILGRSASALCGECYAQSSREFTASVIQSIGEEDPLVALNNLFETRDRGTVSTPDRDAMVRSAMGGPHLGAVVDAVISFQGDLSEELSKLLTAKAFLEEYVAGGDVPEGRVQKSLLLCPDMESQVLREKAFRAMVAKARAETNSI